ncbi:hypothetical protein D9613_008647 [Agrocybe pediades]|uniref:Uncharacterized protein n=1 Tax=Agrocybe pediades TaxID=84607 RepID=A0A8H4QSG6_9AGAR|nr:hypothetical protein D9613_008647 [Agrocybe pediades]
MLAIGELVQFEHLLHVRYLAGLLVDPGIQFIGHSLDYLRNRQVFIAASLTTPLSLIQGGKTVHAHHGSERLIALEVPANQHVLFPRSPDKDMKPLQLSPTLAAVSGWILCLLLALVTIAVVLKRRTWRTLKGKRPSTGVYASSGAGGSRDPPRNPSRRGAGEGSSSRIRRTVVEEAGKEDTVQSNGSAGHGSPPPPPPPPSFPFAILDDWDGRSPLKIDWILLLLVIPLFGLVQGLRYLIRRRKRLAASSNSEKLECSIDEHARALHSEVDEHDLSGFPSANGLTGYERSNTSSGVDHVFPTCRNVLPLRQSQDVELGFWQRCFRLVTSSLVALLSFFVSRLPLLLFFIAGYYPAQNVNFAETVDEEEQVAALVELFTSGLVQAPCVKVNEVPEDAVAEVSILDNVEGLHAPEVSHGSDTILEEKSKEMPIDDKEVCVLDEAIFADDPLSAQSLTPDGNENDSDNNVQAALEETTVPEAKSPGKLTRADVDPLPASATLAHNDESAVDSREFTVGTRPEATTPILLLSPASSILNPSAKAFVPRTRKIDAPKPVQVNAEMASVSTVSLDSNWVQPRSFNRARAKTCVQC